MNQVLSYELFETIAQKVNEPRHSVIVRPLRLDRETAGCDYGMVFDAEDGYTTVLWVGNATLRKGRPCHVWYEATFDNDGDLAAISTFVRSEALDTRMSSLRTLVTNVRALTALAHLRFEACGKRAGSYTVSGCRRPVAELLDVLEA